MKILVLPPLQDMVGLMLIAWGFNVKPRSLKQLEELKRNQHFAKGLQALGTLG